MQRRQFLTATASTAVLSLVPRWVWAEDLADDVRVEGVLGFDLPTRRSKLAGKNAYKGVHGDTSSDRMLLVRCSTGEYGIGRCHSSQEDAAKLLGTPLKSLFDSDRRQISSPLGSQTMPLWDLVGKLTGKPVYELLGGAGPERVPVYDGSLYFLDLLPEYASTWEDRLREEIDMGLEQGHTVFKIKIGRGDKWMSRSEGDRRDRDFVKVACQHAGDAAQMAVDANNGYDFAGAKACMEEIGPLGIPFAEEMFEENVEDCLAMKEFYRQQNFETLLADGETKGNLEDFEPFAKAGAIDVLQGDMNHFGFEGILAEAALGKAQGIQVAPHNWGSLIGFYAQLHVGRALSNFYRAEHDPLTSDLLIAEGFDIAEGKCSVPETPGVGLDLDPRRLADLKPLFDLHA